MNSRFSLHKISASTVLAGAILGSGMAHGDESPKGPQPAPQPSAPAAAAPAANDVKAGATDDVKALAAFKSALELTPEKDRDALRKQIPQQFLARL